MGLGSRYRSEKIDVGQRHDGGENAALTVNLGKDAGLSRSSSDAIDRGAESADVERFREHDVHVHSLIRSADFG
jgi:hypothetical protein